MLKQKLSKGLAFSLAVTAVLSLAACNSGKEGTQSDSEASGGSYIDSKYGNEPPFTNLQGQVVKLGSWWDLTPIEGGSEMDEQRLEKIDYIENKYNCKFEFVPLIESEMMNQIASSVASNAPIVDFTYVQSTMLPVAANKGYLEPLDNITSFDMTDKKWPQFVVNLGTISGKHYAFDMEPIYYPRVVMYWNKTMFEDEGWDNLYELQKNNEWTWDKMLEIAQKATVDTDGDGIPNRYGLTGMGGGLFQYSAMLGNNGPMVTVDESGKPTFTGDQPNAIEALQFTQDLVNKYKVVDEPEKSTWDYYMNAFMDGKAAMCAGELYMSSYLEEMEDEWGIVCTPMGPKADHYVSASNIFGLMVMLANNPLKQEAGFVFDMYTALDPETDYLQACYSTIVKDKESLETIQLIADGAATYNYSYNFTKAHEYAHAQTIEILKGTKTPTVAMSEIKTMMEQLLADDYAAMQ